MCTVVLEDGTERRVPETFKEHLGLLRYLKGDDPVQLPLSLEDLETMLSFSEAFSREPFDPVSPIPFPQQLGERVPLWAAKFAYDIPRPRLLHLLRVSDFVCHESLRDLLAARIGRILDAATPESISEDLGLEVSQEWFRANVRLPPIPVHSLKIEAEPQWFLDLLNEPITPERVKAAFEEAKLSIVRSERRKRGLNAYLPQDGLQRPRERRALTVVPPNLVEHEARQQGVG